MSCSLEVIFIFFSLSGEEEIIVDEVFLLHDSKTFVITKNGLITMDKDALHASAFTTSRIIPAIEFVDFELRNLEVCDGLLDPLDFFLGGVQVAESFDLFYHFMPRIWLECDRDRRDHSETRSNRR
uniref:Uncharacterized protein n=1 Tax=Rhizobium phage LG08 TaxID=3129229 RepID=A0AAU8HYR2_9CAUD